MKPTYGADKLWVLLEPIPIELSDVAEDSEEESIGQTMAGQAATRQAAAGAASSSSCS